MERRKPRLQHKKGADDCAEPHGQAADGFASPDHFVLNYLLLVAASGEALRSCLARDVERQRANPERPLDSKSWMPRLHDRSRIRFGLWTAGGGSGWGSGCFWDEGVTSKAGMSFRFRVMGIATARSIKDSDPGQPTGRLGWPLVATAELKPVATRASRCVPNAL